MPRRPLTPLEIPYIVMNTNVSCGYVIRGPVDPDRVAAAYGALRREHPALSGRIEATDVGFDLVTPEVPPAEAAAPITVEHRTFAPGDVRMGLQPENTLAGVHLVVDGPLSRVTLGVNHAIADGTHILALIRRLWQLYTDPAAYAGPVVELPAAPLDLVARLGDAPVPGVVEVVARSAATTPTAEALDGGEMLFERIHLSAPATEELRRRAKSASLSLHGLLAGILVVAERAELDAPTEEAVEMAVFSPVCLRRHADPPVAATAVTNFAGSSTASLEVRGDTSPEEIGRRVLKQLSTDLADGTAVAGLTGRDPRHVIGGAPVRLSNLGSMPLPTLPDGLTAVDFYTSSEIDMERVLVLMRHSPPEALAQLAGMHYQAVTFAGRLSIELRRAPGTLGAAAVRRIRDRIEASLTAPQGALR